MTDIELEEKLSHINMEWLMCISIEKIEADIEEDDYSIIFSEQFYLENREKVDNFIKELCSYKKKTFKSIMLNSNYHMNKAYFNIIAKNESLKSVTLFNYQLSKCDFEILKQNKSIERIETESVAKELENCYDHRIKAVVGRQANNYISVRDIIIDERLSVLGSLTDEQTADFCTLLEKDKLQGK